jgi:2-C-methyl-D-erythritol 4-phosphate cytidylyltransferase
LKTFAIIPAGGSGKRTGLNTPKQFLKLSGKELIVYTLELFQKNKLIDNIVVAVPLSYFGLLEKIKNKYKLKKIINIVESGRERQDSVYSALKSIKAEDNDLIVVHDAARPFLPEKILTSAVKIAQKKGNALVCTKVKDTLINNQSNKISYIDRNRVFYVQTPQVFKYKELKLAMKSAYKEKFIATDESMLISRKGKKINLVEGSILNFKVTTKEDIQLCRILAGKL